MTFSSSLLPDHSVRLALCAGLVLGLLGLGPVARAVEVPEDQRLLLTDVTAIQMTMGQSVEMMIWSLSPSGTSDPPAAGGQWAIQVVSCGRMIHDEAGTWDGTTTGFLTDFGNARQKLISTSVDYTITISTPEFDPYVISGSYAGFSVVRPSCEVLDGAPLPTIDVTRWSTRKGPARVGRMVGVTGTRAPGAEISYEWRMGSALLGMSRRVLVRRSYVGRRLRMTVTVAQTGAQTRTRTLRYGPVH